MRSTVSDYGRTVQVVITIQSTSLDPETVQLAAEKALERQRLLVDGDTVSAYFVDCECKHCTAEEVSA
jgi:hypothetical protein